MFIDGLNLCMYFFRNLKIFSKLFFRIFKLIVLNRFNLIVLKLYTCFNDGLKICMCLFQKSEITYFFYFEGELLFSYSNSTNVRSRYLVSPIPPTVFGQSL